MPEFTGERVVPGLVDEDLFNEHLARYQFAARLAVGKRVLDAGCGTGYGSAELARFASAVTAIDFSRDAIMFARDHFRAPNVEYRVADCLQLPDGPFDLIVAFEVIEHLEQWRGFLVEVKRTLAPGGLFLVSTPNKLYYAESRGQSGENPFHVHEFEYAEFLAELKSVFTHVGMMLQNHIEGVAFSNPEGSAFDLEVGSGESKSEDSHFFVAVCANEPFPAIESFVWIPGTGNILREREHHIGLLRGEVALKTKWLFDSKQALEDRNREYQELLGTVRSLNSQLEERNRWAVAMHEESDRHGARVVELQEELSREQANFGRAAAGYEVKVSELEETNRAKTEWALETERRLTQEIRERSEELARCAAFLDQAEQTVIERTLWAQSLQGQVTDLEGQLAALRATNWVKAGAKFKLVPEHE